MTAEIEIQASMALYAARLLEAAIHDPGPWTMRWGPVEVPASREVGCSGVTFDAIFPEACWLEPPVEGVLLCLRGEVKGIRRVDHPGDTAFMVRWEILVTPRVDV